MLFFLRLSAGGIGFDIDLWRCSDGERVVATNQLAALSHNKRKKENVNYDNGRHREAFTSRKKIYLTPSEKRKEKDQLGNIYMLVKEVH